MSIFDQFKEAVGSAFTNDETIKPLEGDEKPIVRQAGKVSASWLQEGTFKVDFYLTGVPTTDPSSDLWGSRVDVSTGSYDRTLKAIIPEEPNDTTVVKFNEGGKLFVEDCDFVEGEGLWKLEYEGGVNRLRFSLNTGGFEKMTKTGGSLQNIYGGPDSSITSSSRTIPAGEVIVDIEVRAGGDPGTVEAVEKGLMRVEMRYGLLNARRMMPCGRIKMKTN